MTTFRPIEIAATHLSGFPHPWLIAGGWAIDLHLGRVTRPHKDVDIMIFRHDQLDLQRHFTGWYLYAAHAGALYPWIEGDYLLLPFSTIWAYKPGNPPPHTPDVQDDLEFLLDDIVGDEWRFRRLPVITRPLSKVMMHTAYGIPYLAPEVALLYKAKGCRAEDEADFGNVVELLDAERADWLARSLNVSLPGHKWLARL